jgi:hypothetical protein
MSRGALVHAAHLCPQVLITLFSFDRLPGKILLLADLFEVPVTSLIQAMIGDKNGLDDFLVLPDGNHREIFDIQIDADGHEIRILLADHHFLGCNRFLLGEMEFSRSLAQHQLGARLVPSLLMATLLARSAMPEQGSCAIPSALRYRL